MFAADFENIKYDLEVNLEVNYTNTFGDKTRYSYHLHKPSG